MSLPQIKLTPEQYLKIEREASTRSEYYAGEMFAMSGGDRRHDLIAENVRTRLNLQFWERPCIVHSSDMRVKVNPTGLYTYPDASVVCGDARYEDDHVDTLINPTVIFEVLSRSSEAYDRGEKFAHYRTVESILEYVLITQDRVLLEHFVRQQDESWKYSVYTRLDEVVKLDSVHAELKLSEIYHKVNLKLGETSRLH